MDKSSEEKMRKDRNREAAKFIRKLARMKNDAVELLEKARDPSFLERVCTDPTKLHELANISHRQKALEKELHQECHPPEDFQVSVKEYKELQELRFVHLKEQIDLVADAANSYARLDQMVSVRPITICAEKKLDATAKISKDRDVVMSKAGTRNRADLAANHDAGSEVVLGTLKPRHRPVNRAYREANHDDSSEVVLTTPKRRRRPVNKKS